MNDLNKLLDISSNNISNNILEIKTLIKKGGIFKDLADIYYKKNGFYAFEASLFFLPFSDYIGIISYQSYNSPNGWKKNYEGISDFNVFALDIFGEQFGIYNGMIYKFKPETGELVLHSTSFTEWATLILDNFNYELGWKIANEWQIQNNKTLVGYRLLPKKPFVMGGKYDLKNMTNILIEDYIEKYINLYMQIKNHPDGQAIIIKNWLA